MSPQTRRGPAPWPGTRHADRAGSGSQDKGIPWPERPRRYSPRECGLRGDPFEVGGVRVQLVVGDLRPARVWRALYPDVIRASAERAA